MSRAYVSKAAPSPASPIVQGSGSHRVVSIQAKESATSVDTLLKRAAQLGHNFEQATFSGGKDYPVKETASPGAQKSTIQAKGGTIKAPQGTSAGQHSNRTGLPDSLKAGIEALSDIALDNVKVHYNSSKPLQLGALAYTQGNDIHIGPGQEKHLPHEAWHVVQQAQGRVQPTVQMKDGMPVNDDTGLEHEADVMGAMAIAPSSHKLKAMADNHYDQQQPTRKKNNRGTSDRIAVSRQDGSNVSSPIQMVKIKVDGLEYETNGKTYEELQSLKNRVAAEDKEKLNGAMRIAHALELREDAPSSPKNSGSDSGLRQRGAPTVPPPVPDEPKPAAPTSFATIDGPAAHGRGAWGSTAFAVGTGAPDLAALHNSSKDTVNMTNRTIQDIGKGNFKDAAISATQGALSGVQVALSTPVAHVLNHGVSAMVGSPLPLPVADAIWYPANSAKKGLEKYRDPKDKTK